MYPAPTSTPTPDATPVPIGRRNALHWGLVGAAFAAIALIGLSTVIRVVIDPVRFGDPLETLATGLISLLLFGIPAGLCFRGGRRRRETAIITDVAGLWLTDGLSRTVIPWSDVAAIGLHQYHLPGGRPWPDLVVWSIELHLHEPLDRDDHPLLDRMVLPADPPRYMIRLPRGTYIDAMAAVKARVPELWIEAPESD